VVAAAAVAAEALEAALEAALEEDAPVEVLAEAPAAAEHRQLPTLVVLPAVALDLHAHSVAADTTAAGRRCLTVLVAGLQRA
jgi:hypothetical protein